jgi:hypothetical protein
MERNYDELFAEMLMISTGIPRSLTSIPGDHEAIRRIYQALG